VEAFGEELPLRPLEERYYLVEAVAPFEVGAAVCGTPADPKPRLSIRRQFPLDG
jgi:hypothetical protein